MSDLRGRKAYRETPEQRALRVRLAQLVGRVPPEILDPPAWQVRRVTEATPEPQEPPVLLGPLGRQEWRVLQGRKGPGARPVRQD
jgi:hypothetical protein